MKFRKLGQISNLLIKEKFIMQSNLCCIPGEYFIGISNLYICKSFTLLQSLNFQICTANLYKSMLLPQDNAISVMLFLSCYLCHAFVKCFLSLFIPLSFLTLSLSLSLPLQNFPSYCKSMNVFVLVSNAFSNVLNCFSF